MPFRLKAYWQRRLVRALIGVLILCGAFGAQYYLTDVPVPADLAATGKFTPAALRLGQEELLIEGPEVNSPEGVLFAHAGAPTEVLDVRFERARLDADTSAMLTALGDTLPNMPAQIDYVPQEAKQETTSGEPCRTFVTVAWQESDKPPAALRLFQLEAPGLDHYRYFEMQATGGDLSVRLLPKSAGEEDAPDAPGCRGRLQIGSLTEQLGGGVGVQIVVAADSKFRWHFRPRAQGASLWSGADGLFEPFTLGSPQLDPNEQPPLRARAVRIRSLQADTNAPDILSAQSTDNGPLLNISALKVGSDQLQLNVAGNAWVKVNGQALGTVNLFERATKYPLAATILGVLNAALLAWIFRLIFGRRLPISADN